MSETKKGVVKSVFGPNDYGFYKIKLEDGDTWYGAGKSKPDVSKGDSVSFEFYLKDDKYATIKGKITKTGSGGASSGGSSGSSNDGYWKDKTKYEQEVKDPRIGRSVALGHALAFAVLAREQGALGFLEKVKPAEKHDALLSFVIETADKFVGYTSAIVKAEPTEAEKEQAGGGDDDQAME